MKHALLVAALLAAPIAAALPAQAADTSREGAAYWQSVTVVNLSAEARRTVTADKLTATLSVEGDGRDAAGAQAFVNGKMQLAKVAAGDVAGVKFETGGYNTYQTMPQPAKEGAKPATVWHARQDVNLSGGTAEDLTKLVAQLQKMGFGLQGMGYNLTPEKADAIRAELVNQALDEIKAKAQKMAEHLGFKNVRYATINIGDGGGVIRPMMARMAMAKDVAESMPAPVATAGETEVSVNISAEVHLR